MARYTERAYKEIVSQTSREQIFGWLHWEVRYIGDSLYRDSTVLTEYETTERLSENNWPSFLCLFNFFSIMTCDIFESELCFKVHSSFLSQQD